jgi:hypothetical protein
MVEGGKLYRILVGKSKGKRPFVRPRCRWENGIKMDLREIGWGGGVEWIHPAQVRDHWQAVVNAVMNLCFWHHRVGWLVMYIHVRACVDVNVRYMPCLQLIG